MANFIARFIAHLRLQIGAKQPENAINQFQYRTLRFVGKVEGLASQLWVFSQSLSQHHVGDRAIFSVEIIANEKSIRTHYRALPAQHGTNCSLNQTIPVQITVTVKI